MVFRVVICEQRGRHTLSATAGGFTTDWLAATSRFLVAGVEIAEAEGCETGAVELGAFATTGPVCNFKTSLFPSTGMSSYLQACCRSMTTRVLGGCCPFIPTRTV